jgi:hypothetical protein
MLRLAVLVAALAAACSTKKQPDPAPSAAQPPPTTGALSCARVLPVELRERHFAGATVDEKAQGVDFAVGCEVARGGAPLVSLVVTCHPNMAASRPTTLASMRRHLAAIDLPGVGAAAVSLETAGSRSVSAWDDDSDCHATVTARAAEVDLVGLSKDLLSALPPR